MNNRVLITGVGGLIGSRLADWIIDNIEGATVFGIDDLSGGYRQNIDPRVEFYSLNLTKDNID